MRRGQREREIKPLLRNIPVFLTQLINFLLQNRSHPRTIAAVSRPLSGILASRKTAGLRQMHQAHTRAQKPR
jgi:hypothetical protein